MAAENFRVKKGLEVGTATTITSEGVNVTGVITATQFKGDGSGLTGVVGSGSGVVVKDEGSAVGTAGTINFVGSGVAAAITGGTATVTVNAGGLDNVVEDTTPQLGGNLDLNSKFVTGSGGINVTGVVTATTLKGNGDFVDIDVDGHTELDNVNITGFTTFATGTKFFQHTPRIEMQGNSTATLSFVNATTGTTATDGMLMGFSSSSQVGFINVNESQHGFVLKTGGNATTAERINISGVGTVSIRKGTTEEMIKAIPDGAVELYHDGQQKLTTTINGIEVPDLNVTGVGTVGRLDTSGVTLGTNSTTFAAKFADDAVANFGTNNDLRIYHDDGNGLSYIRQDGTGPLDIRSINDINIRDGNDGDLFIKCEESEGVRLYYEGSEKLITDQAGVKITGVCTATSFSGSGAGLTSIPSAQLSGALPALDGSALTGITASGSGIIVKHDGSTVGTAGTINFSTNLDVSAISAGIVTVTASSGGATDKIEEGNSSVEVIDTGTGQIDVIADGSYVSRFKKVSGSRTYMIVGNPTAVANNYGTNSGNLIVVANNSVEPATLRLFGSGPGASDGTINNRIDFASHQSGSGGQTFAKIESVIRGSSDNSSDLTFHTASSATVSEKVRIRATGNVGIGITNPTSKLHVNGTATATTFSGSGASLTSLPAAQLTGTLPAISGTNLTTLNASELDSGTIPNGRFPATLPAASGANLTSLTAGNISGTIASGQIADEAVTFAKMQHVGTGVFIGRNDSGSGDIETLTAAEARTLLNVADGATAGITTAPSNITATWNVTASNSSGYEFTGPGQDGSEDNPDIYLVRGHKYRFINTTGSSHPFRFRVSSGGSTYTDGISGSENGTQDFSVQHDAPASLVYQCTIHGGMVGNIYIVGQHLANGANNRVLTATSAYGMNGESNLTFDGSTLNNTNGGANFTKSANNYVLVGSTNASGASLVLDGDSNGDGSGTDYAFLTHNTDGDLDIVVDNPANAGNIKFFTNSSTERVRITSGGRLVVKGEDDQDNLSVIANNNTEFAVHQDDTDGEVSIRAQDPSGNNNAKYMTFYTHPSGSAAAERIRITPTGDVKIGSGDPDGKLHLDGIGSGDIVAEFTSGSPMFTYRNGSGAWFHAGKHPSDDAFVVTHGGNTTATEVFRISSDGHITAPHNVAFSANGGPSDVSNNVIIFGTSLFQRGGTNYSTSTGVFTAPVDGIYHFMCNPYRYTDSNDSSLNLQVSTNGGTTWSTQIEIRNMNNYSGDSGRGWFTLSLSNLIDLNANDQVRVYAVNRVHCNGVFSRFSGFLVA